MQTKAKKNWFKERANAVRSTAVRDGYRRYTTYYSFEMLAWIKQEAIKQNKWVTDIIGDALNDYRKRIERREEKAKDCNRQSGE